MRRHFSFAALIMVLLLSLSPAHAQDTPGTVKFPAAADSLDSLMRASNLSYTTTTAIHSSTANEIKVISTAGFPSTGALAIGTEIIFYKSKTSTTFNGLVRGAEGSTAATHLTGVSVRVVISAGFHNTLAAAMMNVQAKLGIGATTASNGTVLKGTGAGLSAWSLLTNSDLPQSPTFSGTVTALKFVGDCSGCTGLTGATGGISNTGSTTAGADTDADGVGVIDLQTRNLTRLRVNNDGLIETPYGQSVMDKGGQVYNVAAYGASTSSTTNQTAIQAAIDAASAAFGGVVLLPKLYTVSAQIVMKSNVTLRAQAGGGLVQNGNFALLYFNGISNAAVEELFINGQQTGVSGINYLVHVTGTSSNIRIRRNTLRNARATAVFVQSASKVAVEDNLIEASASHGVFFSDDVSSSNVSRNKIFNAGTNATSGDAGKAVGVQCPNVACYRIAVNDNIIYNPRDMGIELWGGPNGVQYGTVNNNLIEISSLVFTGNYQHGISIDGSRYVTVTGNTVRGSTCGLEVAGSSYVTVTGNTAIGVQGVGLWITNNSAGHVVASSNIIKDSTGHGLEINAGSDKTKYVLSSNLIEGSGARGIFLNSLGVDADFAVTGNTVTGSVQSGIYIFQSDGGAVTGNHLRGNNPSNSLAEGQFYLNMGGGTTALKIAHIGNYGDLDNYLTSPLLIAGAGTFPDTLNLLASSHGTSERAGMKVGDWLFAQDAAGNGTKDFILYNVNAGGDKWKIGTDGKHTFYGDIRTADDVEVTNSAKGLILRSPDGTRYRITVGNGGALSTTAVP